MDATAIVTIGFVAALLGWFFYMGHTAKAAVGRSATLLSRKIPELDDKKGPVLVYCFSPKCGPCRRMLPVIDDLKEETGRVVKFDVTSDMALAQQMGIRATPTLLLVAGGQVQQVLIGAQPADKLRGLLQQPQPA